MNQKLLEHYQNPRNQGKPKHFTHEGTVKNRPCGDEIGVFVELDLGELKSIHFQARGCALLLATASILSEELKGKSISQVKSYSLDQIQEHISLEIPKARSKCVTLPIEAIRDALTH